MEESAVMSSECLSGGQRCLRRALRCIEHFLNDSKTLKRLVRTNIYPHKGYGFPVTQRACERDSPATTHGNLRPGSTGEPESETPGLFSSRLS